MSEGRRFTGQGVVMLLVGSLIGFAAGYFAAGGGRPSIAHAAAGTAGSPSASGRIAEIQQAVDRDPENPELLTALGNAYYDREDWAFYRGVQLDFTRPGKPTENAFIESFNGRLRDECLNVHQFVSVDDARTKIEAWRLDYNQRRPHSSLGHLTPDEYVEQRQNPVVVDGAVSS